MTEPGERSWELWDRPGVVPDIQKRWSCPGELAHRETLAKLSSGHIRKGDLFLEVGCGSGLMYQALSRIVTVSYTGVDTSMEMLRAAQAAFPDVDFEIGDGFNLPFEAKSFDVVACYDVLQHVPDMVGFIKELIRVSRRTVLFTILETPQSIFGKQTILGNAFIENKYSKADAKARVDEASGGRPFEKIFIPTNKSNLWVLGV